MADTLTVEIVKVSCIGGVTVSVNPIGAVPVSLSPNGTITMRVYTSGAVTVNVSPIGAVNISVSPIGAATVRASSPNQQPLTSIPGSREAVDERTIPWRRGCGHNLGLG